MDTNDTANAGDETVEAGVEGTETEQAYRAIGIDPATGFATDGDLPINGRLRAEALARRGDTTDAGGLVGDDLIAATAERLQREDAEAERIAAEEAKAHPPVSERMGKDRLVEIATDEGAAVDPEANKPAIVAAIEANRLTGKEA